ncbi:MAG: c-type cytochrome, partial [Verrucomicrobia bacterium]|nr:c-type cytochrome [Verrucomicrobiota bacterium]
DTQDSGELSVGRISNSAREFSVSNQMDPNSNSFVPAITIPGGLGITEDNIIIGSTANGNASMYMPIPNRFYEQVNGWSAARLESIADSQNFYPITEKVRQVDWHGRYTAGSGSAIYTARSFPREFWNRAQFVAEPTGHLLGLFFLDRTGADFRAHNSRNFLASDDEWTSPIYGEVGPDGALWVVDWYNYIIQHNPTPKGFDNGKGNAYETPIRDKSHGRIYRVTHRGGRESIQPTLSTDQPDHLVSTLQNDNLIWRLHAQRLLIERNKTDVVPALIRLASGTILDDINLAPGAIHSLWVLKGLGILDSGNASAIQVTVDALKHPSAAVRRAAAMVLPRNRATLNALLDAGILNDEDAQVRLAALLALSELPSDAGVGQSILDMLLEPRNANDKWIADAAVSAAAQNDSAFLNAYLSHARGNQSISNAENSRQGLQRVVETVTQHYARRGPTDSIVSTLAALNGVSPNVATSVLDGLKDGWPGDISPELSISEKQQLEKVMDSLPEIVRDRLLSLGEQWKVPGLFEGRMAAIVASLRGQVADEKSSAAQRSAAAKRWIMLEDSTPVVENVLSHISLLSSPDLSSGLVSALSESRKNETGTIIMKHWATFTPAVRRSAISVLLRRSEWALAMLDSVEDMSISRMDIPNEYWSQLRQNPNRRVAGRANRLSSASASISADRAEIVNKLLPLAKEKGDAAAGKAVFEAYCFVCHAFNGNGGQVGPDLTGIGSRDRSDILLEILDPNRSVEANYRLWNVTTVDGNTFSGRLDAETQTTVEIMDVASQKHVIQRKEIESLEASQMSIMPVGFESIPPKDLKALLEYLSQPH